VTAILVTAVYRTVSNHARLGSTRPSPHRYNGVGATCPPDNSHSLARFLEVSGVRFVELNETGNSVPAHSKAPLSSLTVYVTLRAANAKQGQAPLARFMFRSPNLAAYEAKEMANPIEHIIGPLDLPDWQDLRADVEVQ
jgi:hypothetical protein